MRNLVNRPPKVRGLARPDLRPALHATNAYLEGRRHLRAAKVLEIAPIAAGAKAWYDAGNGTGGVLAGDPVSQWTDATAGGTDLTQGNAAMRPAYYPTGGPNNKPRVVFDGVDDGLACGTCGFVSAVFTIMLVMNKKDFAAEPFALSQDAFSDECAMFLTGRPLHHTRYGDWSGRPHQTTFDAGFHVHTLAYGAQWYQLDYWVDGIQANGTMQLTGNPSAFSAIARGINLGKSSEGATPSPVTVCELILFNQILSSRVRAGVELYLRNKYAL